MHENLRVRKIRLLKVTKIGGMENYFYTFLILKLHSE